MVMNFGQIYMQRILKAANVTIVLDLVNDRIIVIHLREYKERFARNNCESAARDSILLNARVIRELADYS